MTVRLYYNAVDRRAQASNEWHAEWISKRGLKARLWTDKAISEFLGAPLSAGRNNVAHGWLRGVKYPLIQSCLATWMLR